MRKYYEHRQSGWLLLIVALSALVGLEVAYMQGQDLGRLASPMPAYALWLVLALVVLVPLCFSSLRIAIIGDELRWHFGPGVWRKRIKLSDIESFEATRTRLIEGWGIHRTCRGWLYNVSGFDAVLVRKSDGKSVLLGTDEPQRLLAALRRATKQD